MFSSDLSEIQELALLDLYKREIVRSLQAIYSNPSLSLHISVSDQFIFFDSILGKELLAQNEVDKLHLSATNDKSFAEKLWESMLVSPMKGAIYRTLLNYLAKGPIFRSFSFNF